MEVYIYHIEKDGETKYFVSILSNKHVYEHGLSTFSIIGVVENRVELKPEEFTPNTAFLNTFHNIIASKMLLDSFFIQQANELINGVVYMVDGRTKDPKNVPPEDVIGALKAVDGVLQPNSYQKNFSYKLLTENGFFQIPDEYHLAILEEVKGSTNSSQNADNEDPSLN